MIPDFLTNPDPSVFIDGSYVVLDFETTSKDKGSALHPDNRLVLAVWGDNAALWHRRGGIYDQAALIRAVERADFIVAHGSKFELQWLKRMGVDIGKLLVFDTLLAQYVINGNRKTKLDLSSVATLHGLGQKESIVATLIKMGADPEDIDPRWLLEYCEQDVMLTHSLLLVLRAKLADAGLLPVYFARSLTVPVLADIEANGVALDRAAVTEEYLSLVKQRDELMRRLDEFTGGINPRSPKQVAAFLYDTLNFPVPEIRGEKVRTTDSKVVSRFRSTNKRQSEFLEMKKQQGKLDAALSKTIKPFYDCVQDTPIDEVPLLYAGFNQSITQTHRLSSSGKRYGVQFQNFPRHYKRLIKARLPKWSIGEVDGAQLEFRAAVLLARDEQGIYDIENNVDIHAFTASIIFREQFEEVQAEVGCDVDLLAGAGNELFKKHKIGKDIRQRAKEHTFKPLYGGQSGTEREQEYYAAFKERYKQIAAMQQAWKDEVLVKKCLTTATGLIFYWPDTKLTKTGYITNSTNICNYPVQCVDADTEFFNGVGWVPIHQYVAGDKVAAYDPKRGTLIIEEPRAFVHNPPSPMIGIRKQGIDKVVTGNHRLVLRTEKTGYIKVVEADEFIRRYNETARGVADGVITTFSASGSGNDIDEWALRLLVAFQADGSFYKSTGRGLRKRKIKYNHIFNFSKARKIERLIWLLDRAGCMYEIRQYRGSTRIVTNIPVASKLFNSALALEKVSPEEARIIYEECLLWDGHNGRNPSYSSKIMDNADFIQWCASAIGLRAHRAVSPRGQYTVTFSTESSPTFRRDPGGPSCLYDAGSKESYCFTTRTGMWLSRRNGHIAVTGNCFATADIIPAALRLLWQDMRERKMQSFIINTVHDSAIAEVAPDEKGEYERMAAEAFGPKCQEFIAKLYGFEFCVDLASEIKFGEHW